jgi:hypothetical protein
MRIDMRKDGSMIQKSIGLMAEFKYRMISAWNETIRM